MALADFRTVGPMDCLGQFRDAGEPATAGARPQRRRDVLPEGPTTAAGTEEGRPPPQPDLSTVVPQARDEDGRAQTLSDDLSPFPPPAERDYR